MTPILNTPLKTLRFDVRLRRALINHGYETLDQVLAAQESQLEEELDAKALASLAQLKERIRKDPEGFLEEATAEITPERRAEIERRLAETRKQSIELGRVPLAGRPKRSGHSSREPDTALPDARFVEPLKGHEAKAQACISLLADHAERAIVAECFPKLVLDLDDLRSDFIELFAHYKDSSRSALRIACTHFPNAFLVFVAHSASEDFDGDAFWNNLYALLQIDSQNVQGELKQAFYQGVKDRGFPYFTNDDSDFHLLHTALLHGGFSQTFWEPMWRDVIIPYAKSSVGVRITGKDAAQLLHDVRQNVGSYGLNRVYAKRILEKAPTSMLEPLIESALRVAKEVIELESDRDQLGNSFGMTSSHGLTDSAMQALRSVLESRGAKSSRRIVYLPSAELRIKPEDGVVHLHWDAQKLPSSFAGRSIAYIVNGEEIDTAELNMGVGKCILEERSIAIKPSERFDVEIVMYDSGETQTKLASLNQTFDRTRPGSFEFVQSSDGIFRLRKPSERLKRPKTVAFLTKAGLRVLPGKGMTELEAYSASDSWKGASVQVFDIEPGSSGSIVNTLTGEEIACWQEDYNVEVDRSHMIGKTADKRDLYGFSYLQSSGTNASLPEIVIEAHDVTAIRGDLDISCVCDGKEISLPWEAVQDEIDHDYVQSGRLIVKPREAAFIERFVREGSIRIAQKSTGQALLNYKFAVIPMRSFGISDLRWEDEKLMATYSFEAMDPMTVPDEFGDYEMLRGDTYSLDAPLADEAISTTVRSDITGKSLDVLLYLANVRIDIPDEIVEANKERPLCMADAEEMDGRMSIVSTGRRHGRYACVMMGMEPILYKKLSGNTTYSFDIFKDPRRLALNGKPEEKNVTLIITHGERAEAGKQVPAWAEVILAHCTTGYDLGKPRIIWKDSGHHLSFEHSAPVDFEVWFSEPKRGRQLGMSILNQGERSTPIPQDAAYKIDVRQTVAVTMVPLSMFGEPDESMAAAFLLSR